MGLYTFMLKLQISIGQEGKAKNCYFNTRTTHGLPADPSNAACPSPQKTDTFNKMIQEKPFQIAEYAESTESPESPMPSASGGQEARG